MWVLTNLQGKGANPWFKMTPCVCEGGPDAFGQATDHQGPLAQKTTHSGCRGLRGLGLLGPGDTGHAHKLLITSYSPVRNELAGYPELEGNKLELKLGSVQ